MRQNSLALPNRAALDTAVKRCLCGTAATCGRAAGAWEAGTGFGCGLARWDVGHVRDFKFLFEKAIAFEGDGLAPWNVSSAVDMRFMFSAATAFNGDLSRWDTSHVKATTYMFKGAASFNGDLSHWNVAQVTDMDSMFEGAAVFDADVSAWDTGRVTTMDSMFEDASSFSADLSAWNVSRAVDRSWMFTNARRFNHTLCGRAWIETHTTARQFWMFAGAGPGARIGTELCSCSRGQFLYHRRSNQSTSVSTTGLNCRTCVAGRYQANANVVKATTCPFKATTCPPGTFSDSASMSCAGCPVARWSDQTGITSDAQCVACEYGARTFVPGQRFPHEACVPPPLPSNASANDDSNDSSNNGSFLQDWGWVVVALLLLPTLIGAGVHWRRQRRSSDHARTHSEGVVLSAVRMSSARHRRGSSLLENADQDALRLAVEQGDATELRLAAEQGDATELKVEVEL